MLNLPSAFTASYSLLGPPKLPGWPGVEIDGGQILFPMRHYSVNFLSVIPVPFSRFFGFVSEGRTFVFLPGIFGGPLSRRCKMSRVSTLLTLKRWPRGDPSKRWYLSYGSKAAFCMALIVGRTWETIPPLLKTLWRLSLWDVTMSSCLWYLRGFLATVLVSLTS